MHTMVKCISIETGTIAPDHYCDRKKKPSTMIPCNRHRCPIWNTGDWSQVNYQNTFINTLNDFFFIVSNTHYIDLLIY